VSQPAPRAFEEECGKMAKSTGSTSLQSESGDGPETVPIMQQILDNPFLLLFIGVTVPTVFYILWGVMEIVTIPIAK
jgi:hypothetical protein